MRNIPYEAKRSSGGDIPSCLSMRCHDSPYDSPCATANDGSGSSRLSMRQSVGSRLGLSFAVTSSYADGVASRSRVNWMIDWPFSGILRSTHLPWE